MLTLPTLRVALAAGAVALVPATASAATVTPDRACYVQAGQLITKVNATVAGAAAGQSVGIQLTRKGNVLGRSAAVAADGAGNVGLEIPSWTAGLKATGSKDVKGTVEAVDTTTGASLGAAEVRVAELGFSVKGTSGLRSWKVQGLAALTGQSTYYAHYENNGKYKGRLKLGKAKGPCGYLSTRKPLTPFSKLGRYDVYIQASKTLDRNQPHLVGRVTVTTRRR